MKKYLTDIDGVFASAIASGIKKNKPDLGVLYVPGAVACAGVFTQHLFSASSVKYTRKCLKRHTLKAVIINSGNANAVTGKQGDEDTKTMAVETAKLLNLSPSEVGVASTGIIGVPLPMSKILKALPKVCQKESLNNGQELASAILTTDLTEKVTFKEAKIGKKIIQVSGITKGSGMIAPNMATTLGFLVTNVNVSHAVLQRCLKHAIDRSYNMLSVDTDTSTNDMVLCFATGAYAVNEQDHEQMKAFQNLLNEACIDLAKQIAKDGEGATKLIEVYVKNAPRYLDAKQIAKQVIDSPLVKTAIHGEDPNWGRLIMAIGKNETIKLNPNKVHVMIGDKLIVENGLPTKIDRAVLKKELKKNTILITVDCTIGKSNATAWGCDLTKGYIDINTDYN